MPNDCPPADQLRKFAVGDVSERDAKSVEEHLDTCERCWETVMGESKNDTLTEAVVQSPSAVADEGAAQVEGMIRRIEALRNSGVASAIDATQDLETPGVDIRLDTPTEAGEPVSTSDDIDFLAPAEGPGELGRLGGYRILQVLGSGGMGVVFLAEDPQLQRRVALKVMRPALAASKTARQRFLREARIAASIEHDNLVHIYQVGEDRSMPFLAMQLLKGESLEERLRRDVRLPIVDVLRIGRQIAEGLSAAHGQGLIHRDIKPANVFLQRTEADAPARASGSTRVKILDFGLARAVEDDTHITGSGMIAGTPAYMAPEQALAEPVDARTDLFSLGCVLYRMLVGRTPFRGGNTTAVLVSLTTENPTPPDKMQADVPRELSHLVIRLLAKKPAERLQSAKEVVESLTEIERGLSPEATREVPSVKTAVQRASTASEAATVPAHGKLSSKTGSRSKLIVAAAAVILLVAGGIVFRLATDQGELIIKTDDPNIEVTIKRNGENYKELTLRPTPTEVSVYSGNVEVVIKGAKASEFLVKNGKVSLQRGDRKIVEIERIPVVARVPVTAPAYELGLHQSGAVVVPTLNLNALEHGTLETYVTPLQEEQMHIVGVPRQFSLFLNSMGKPPCWDVGLNSLKGFHSVLTNLPVEIGRRVHLAGVRDGTEIRLYVDGKLVGKKAIPAGPLSPEQDKWLTLGGNTQQMRMGPVRISTSARYNKDFTPETRFSADKDTLALYHFDEGQGDKLTDSSGNNHHGKILGGKWLKLDGTPAVAFEASKTSTDTLSLVRTFPGHESIIREVDFLADGKRAVSAGWDGMARLWDVQTGKELRRFSLPENLSKSANAVAVSPDGKTLALGSSAYSVHTFDVETGKPGLKYVYGGHPAISAIAFTPDSKGLLFSANDGAVAYFKLGDKKATRIYKGDDLNFARIVVLPDGKRFLAGAGKVINLFQLDQEKPVLQFQGPKYNVCGFAMHPDGKRLIGTSLEVFVWDLQSGKELRRFTDPHRKQFGVISGVAITPDGTHLVAGSTDKYLTVWNLTTGAETQRLESKTNCFNRVALSPDGRHILTGGGGTNDAAQNFKLVLDGDFALRLYQLPQLAEKRSALRFNGPGDYIVGFVAIASRKPWTIETWATAMKPAPQDELSIIVGGAEFGITLLQSKALGLRWHMFVVGAERGAYFSDQNATLGRPTHLAVVHDGTSVRLYVDGVPQGTARRYTSKEEKLTVVPGPSQYSASEGRPGYIGTLGPVRISSVARYKDRFTPAQRFEPDQDTIALYRYDEGRGETLTDSSVNGHNFKIVGAKWVREKVDR